MNGPDALPIIPDVPSDPAAPARSWFWHALRLVQVRARFLIVLVAIGLVVGQWERLAGYWNWATRQALGQADRPSAVSPDTEFFCPMDPGVVSPWEDKCPICNMALVRRKKGDAAILPEGVVARMQVSPYRLQLAGVRTAAVEYRPLAREIVAIGPLRMEEGEPELIVEAQMAARDWPFLSIGLEAQARLPAAEMPPAKARLTALHPQPQLPTGVVMAEFRLEDLSAAWQPGALVSIVIRTPLADVEPYRSQSRQPPPLRAGEPRIAYVSRQHPEVVRDRPGRCPIDNTQLERLDLADNQRLAWWCPMHPEIVANEDGHACAKCSGMKLLPRIVSYAPSGTVLAVPAGAVLDTGRQQVVYVEVAPGMLEGWKVQLGTRAGDYYPVLSGLSPSNRVVAAGAFLIDAEARLSGQAATAYFGAASTSP